MQVGRTGGRVIAIDVRINTFAAVVDRRIGPIFGGDVKVVVLESGLYLVPYRELRSNVVL